MPAVHDSRAEALANPEDGLRCYGVRLSEGEDLSFAWARSPADAVAAVAKKKGGAVSRVREIDPAEAVDALLQLDDEQRAEALRKITAAIRPSASARRAAA